MKDRWVEGRRGWEIGGVLNVNRYMAGRERIVDKISCFVDVEESCIDSLTR